MAEKSGRSSPGYTRSFSSGTDGHRLSSWDVFSDFFIFQNHLRRSRVPDSCSLFGLLHLVLLWILFDRKSRHLDEEMVLDSGRF
jgi:hypothetical protein